MKTISSLLPALCLILASCNFQSMAFPFHSDEEISYSDTLTFNENVNPFEFIEVGQNFDVEYVKSDNYAITVFMNDGNFRFNSEGNHLKIWSENGETPVTKTREIRLLGIHLKIDTNENEWSEPSKMYVKVEAPTLKGVQMSGAARFFTEEILQDDEQLIFMASGVSKIDFEKAVANTLTLNASGCAQINGGIETATCSVALSGSSTSDLKGNANLLTVALSGVSELTAGGNYNILQGALSGNSHLCIEGNVNTQKVTTQGVSSITVNKPQAEVVLCR